MNGIHDVGGMDGFGKIVIEENEPLFHEEWERRAFGLLNGALGQGWFNLDEMRHGIERMGPVEYLTSGYYGHWTATLATLLVEKGMVDAEELESRTQAFLVQPDREMPRNENPDLVNHMQMVLKYGASTHREIDVIPKYQIGDRVKTINISPTGHTRLPRYARAKYGVIQAVYGAHVFPDGHAHGKGEGPEYLYSVRIEADELWGSNQSEAVYIDLWESHLEPA
ncbi:nitrile hydratase subunit beta [Paenibacillus abyssi]|uniref:Nitrile hydratase subunit beta n=1 Tax=Paenibacillus abyssi TaxID=1340531 RepID=A0A917CPQ9_9BACL|nr:nitrile hydratase subunit beta [Paenibacillus abyssi]GGF94289.1 nitrile hydratase subunit beta protein [Paenibacillus abyssi]